MSYSYRKNSGIDVEKIVIIGFIALIFIVSFGMLFIPKEVLYRLSNLPLFLNLGC
jgi:hypothetical protein